MGSGCSDSAFIWVCDWLFDFVCLWFCTLVGLLVFWFGDIVFRLCCLAAFGGFL